MGIGGRIHIGGMGSAVSHVYRCIMTGSSIAPGLVMMGSGGMRYSGFRCGGMGTCTIGSGCLGGLCTQCKRCKRK